jgi:nucleoside-diphosphate-sugar epimerase
MAKIFITGVTGFLGSNIAEYLVAQGHNVIATIRSTSSVKLCTGFEKEIIWINQDEDDWCKKIIEYKPDAVVHSAWLGVTHHDRDNWQSQFLNVNYLNAILNIAAKSGTKKFIGLGSQAEYGVYDGVVDEQHPCRPYQAYGCVKVINTEVVKQFCTYHQIDWYWLRLFSFFGKGESDQWLIPSLVKRMMTDKYMDLTQGEQKYAYLYVKDLAYSISLILNKEGTSGVYNISGEIPLTLRSLIEKIRNLVNPEFMLNFGKLPYRQNQPMHTQGEYHCIFARAK